MDKTVDKTVDENVDETAAGFGGIESESILSRLLHVFYNSRLFIIFKMFETSRQTLVPAVVNTQLALLL